MTGQEFEEKALAYLDIQDKIKGLKSEADAIRDELVEWLESQNFKSAKGDGFEIKKRTRKGAVDIKAIQRDYGILDYELNGYRQPSTRYWTINKRSRKKR